MLTLFRGDDLAFAECDRKVCVRFNTCLDLTGWSAKFCLFDNIKQTNDISSRLWTFGYTAEETQEFPLGKTFGKLVIYDQKGLLRQMAKVEVEIINQILEPCIHGYIAISIDNVVADYLNIANNPEINGVVIVGNHDAAYYGLASAADIAPLPGLMETVAQMTITVTDQGEAIANNYMKIIDLQTQIDKLKPQELDELIARLELVESVLRGEYPIRGLLFKCESDTENNYGIKVVLRDDGTGTLVPSLEVYPVPIEDSSSSDDDSSSSE